MASCRSKAQHWLTTIYRQAQEQSAAELDGGRESGLAPLSCTICQQASRQHSGLLSEHVENNHLHRIGFGYAIALSLCGSCQHSTVSALLCGMPRIVSAAVEPCSVVTDAMLCLHAVMLMLDNWPELEPEAGLGMVRVA